MKGFLPVDKFMRQKKIPIKQNKLTPNSEKLDKPDEDAYTNSSVSGASKVESNKTLPRSPCKIRFRPAQMESKESSGHDDKDDNADTIKIVNTDANADANKIDDTDANNANDDDNNDGVKNCARQQIRYKTDLLDKKEMHTAHNYLEDLRHKFILEHQELQGISGSISQLLSDHSRIQEAATQLTKEAEKGDLDVIVRARVAAVVGLLNLFANKGLDFSWKKASEVVSKAQGHGTHCTRCIREWAIIYLRWRDLPLHQMDQKRGTILNDEDVAEEMRAQLMEKKNLKANNVVKIVVSPEMQAILAWKGLRKVSISAKIALQWLANLGWTYGKLRNGMYVDGHEREDVVEYRWQFVECWMEHE